VVHKEKIQEDENKGLAGEMSISTVRREVPKTVVFGTELVDWHQPIEKIVHALRSFR
jgi:hypothetical protein